MESFDIAKHRDPIFWTTFILYIILGLVAIILAGMVLRGGYNSKGAIWTFYAINLVAFIATIALLAAGHKVGAGFALVIQFVFLIVSLVYSNEKGNVVASDPTGQYATTGKYTAAIVFAVLALIVGIPAVYTDQPILATLGFPNFAAQYNEAQAQL